MPFFSDIFRIAPHFREITSLWNDITPLIPKVSALEKDFQALIPRTIALWKQLEPVVDRARALQGELFPQAAEAPPDPSVEMVKWAQLRLNQLGERLAVDGDAGTATQAALSRYQHSHGLTVDGILGPETIKSLWGRQ